MSSEDRTVAVAAVVVGRHPPRRHHQILERCLLHQQDYDHRAALTLFLSFSGHWHGNYLRRLASHQIALPLLHVLTLGAVARAPCALSAKGAGEF